MKLLSIFLLLDLVINLSLCSVASVAISNDAPKFPAIDHPSHYVNIASQSKAIPTNQWWTNAILGEGSATIVPHPYQLQLRTVGIAVGAPEEFTSSNNVVDFPFTETLLISSQQKTPNQFLISDFDELSISVTWNSFQSTFARGAAFITVRYEEDLPRITCSKIGFKKLTAVSSSKYRVEMVDGSNWLIYCPVELQLKLFNKTMILGIGDDSFRGVVQFAYVPKAMRNASSYFGNGEELFDRSAGIYVTGAQVSYEMTSDNSASIRFLFKTNMSSLSTETSADMNAAISADDKHLLMYALPHHIDAMSSSVRIAWPRAVRSIRGRMTAVWGAEWNLIEPNLGSHIEFESPTPLSNDCTKKEIIRQALVADTANLEITPTDPYFFGKAIARIARLYLIADELGETQIAQKCLSFGREKLDSWLLNTSIFRYDRTWGGVVTARSILNPGNDFGMGWYNDHHYHYGYFLYAAAAFGKDNQEGNSSSENSQWLLADATRYDAILSLLRDVANPSSDDGYFPVVRHMDWFEGHSWAQGISVSSNGKNQESTSEAMNAYYSVSLLGKVLNRADLRDLGRILLFMEIRSAKRYYHIRMTNDDVYESPQFSSNAIVGILWSNRAEYNTWFGSNTEFIHCIHMLPFTPIMEIALSDPDDWIRSEYPVLASGSLDRENPVISSAWRSFVYQAHALIDRESAWSEIRTLQQFDDGSSAAIAFYWIAMRPNSALTFDENDQKKKKETVPKEEAEVPRGEVLKKQIGEDNKKKKKKVVTAETFSAKINFQTVGSFTPWTYVADTGSVFGSRDGTNLKFGWSRPNNRSIVRSNTKHWSALYDSFIRLGDDYVWEIEVPIGTYNVLIGLGDPDRANCHSIAIENIPFLSGCTKLSDPFPFLVSDLRSVTVLDGRLTISPAYDYEDDVILSNKLLFLEIYPCPGPVLETQLTQSQISIVKRIGQYDLIEKVPRLLSELTTEPVERFHVLQVIPIAKVPGTFSVKFLVKSSGAFSYRITPLSVSNRIVNSAQFSWSNLKMHSTKLISDFRYKSIVPKLAISTKGLSSFQIVSIVAGIVTAMIAAGLLTGGVWWWRKNRALSAEEQFDLEMRSEVKSERSTDNLLPPVTLSESELAPPIVQQREVLQEVEPEAIRASALPVRPDTPAAPQPPTNGNSYGEFVNIPLGEGVPAERRGSDPKVPTPRLIVSPPTPPTPTRNLLHLLLKGRQNSAPSLINVSQAPAPAPPPVVAHQFSTPTLMRRQYLDLPPNRPSSSRRPSVVPAESKSVGL